KSQIMAEYRQRTRQLRPDKSLKQIPEIFHELQKANVSYTSLLNSTVN
ncbi:DnaJ domain-containing protein, partial [Wuchereria bancrofti]